jgi:predicted GNAT family acetyltransferase
MALRYQREVTPFAATADDGGAAIAALGHLIPEDRSIILLQAEPTPVPPGAVVELQADGVQMVAEHMAAPDPDDRVIDLGDADAAEMLALATLTKPGPFLPRTHRLGGFVGIREQGRLVAMAGERISLPGFTEVSGVCTHPDSRGRGYAGLLSRIVAARIAARVDTPFLHAWASNTAAIRLYETLGFSYRRAMVVTMLRCA